MSTPAHSSSHCSTPPQENWADMSSDSEARYDSDSDSETEVMAVTPVKRHDKVANKQRINPPQIHNPKRKVSYGRQNRDDDVDGSERSHRRVIDLRTALTEDEQRLVGFLRSKGVDIPNTPLIEFCEMRAMFTGGVMIGRVVAAEPSTPVRLHPRDSHGAPRKTSRPQAVNSDERDCKYGLECTNYTEAHRKAFVHPEPVQRDCKYGLECTNYTESHRKTFVHPEPVQRDCKYGLECTNDTESHDHMFSHSNTRAERSKLKEAYFASKSKYDYSYDDE